FFLGSLDLERVLNYGPMAIGLAFLPVALVMGVFSIRFSAQLINRFGPLTVMVAGQVVAVIALAMLGFGPTNAGYALQLMVPLALTLIVLRRPAVRVEMQDECLECEAAA